MNRTIEVTHRCPTNWSVRAPHGDARALPSSRSVVVLAELARLILEGEITSDCEISAGDGSWRCLADVVEPESLGVALRALGHVAPRPTV